MKKVFIFILSFILIPSITMAKELCINDSGSNGCSMPVGISLRKTFAQSFADGDTIKLQSDIDTFYFEVWERMSGEKMYIDLNGYTIDHMNLGCTHMGDTSGFWPATEGSFTWIIMDSGTKVNGNKTGRIEELIVGENTSKCDTTADITGILFEPGNIIKVKKDGTANLISSAFKDLEKCENSICPEDSSSTLFISNDGTTNIKSGTYYNVNVHNYASMVLGETSGTDNPKLFYSYIYNGSSYGSTPIMTINSGTYSNNTHNRHLIENRYNTLTINGGTFNLNEDYFFYNDSSTATINDATVNSNASLFNIQSGTMNINGGTYKTTTEEEAFSFSGGTTNFNSGTIEAKKATVGYVKADLNVGSTSASATSTTPTIDMPKGNITMNASGVINFNSGVINLAKRIDRLTPGTITPRAGYYLNYTPVSDSYYKLHLTTTDTESTNPQYITGDGPIYLVTFDLAGGSGSATSQTIQEGNKVTKPKNDPTRSGYLFKGWYLQDNLYDFATPVTDDINLVAHWAKYYTVTLNPNGGVLAEEHQTIKAVENEPLPTENLYQPYRKDYSFAGWYTAPDLQTIYDINDDSLLVISDFTLYAKWYKQYDWNKDNNFTIEDIGYYRYYLAGNEMEVNGKKYEDLDYYEKLALNSNWDTNVNIIDLVHARAALADKEQV